MPIPAGTRVAMDVLKSFSGRKIVVTPGMVELGAVEEQENRLFGENMAGVADFVYLVGPKHTRPIYEGLQTAGFDMQRVFVWRLFGRSERSDGANSSGGRRRSL